MYNLLIYSLIALAVLYILKELVFTSAWIGKRGEKLTERELNRVAKSGRTGCVLRNVYVPKDNGETSEIDVLYITKKGIFVIESKNYSGWVFGDEAAQYWTVTLPNKQRNRLYNPIKQNQTHIKWLGKTVGEEIPLFSLVVFSERCELKKISVTRQDVTVIKRNRLYATVCKLWDNAEDALNEEAVQSLYEKLKTLTEVDAATKAAHVENIEKKFKQPAAAADTEAAAVSKEQICPRCGKPLVLRNAKRGEHAGKQFYGCSGYPKCRYIAQAEEA